MKKISTHHISKMSDAQCRQMATHYYLRAVRAEKSLAEETRLAVEVEREQIARHCEAAGFSDVAHDIRSRAA